MLSPEPDTKEQGPPGESRAPLAGVPPRKDRAVAFTLPTLNTAADTKDAAAAIVRAVADGDLTPIEAAELSKVLDNFIRILETTEFEARLQALERRASS